MEVVQVILFCCHKPTFFPPPSKRFLTLSHSLSWSLLIRVPREYRLHYVGVLCGVICELLADVRITYHLEIPPLVWA
jgi:hypothetical protein